MHSICRLRGLEIFNIFIFKNKIYPSIFCGCLSDQLSELCKYTFFIINSKFLVSPSLSDNILTVVQIGKLLNVHYKAFYLNPLMLKNRCRLSNSGDIFCTLHAMPENIWEIDHMVLWTVSEFSQLIEALDFLIVNKYVFLNDCNPLNCFHFYKLYWNLKALSFSFIN